VQRKRGAELRANLVRTKSVALIKVGFFCVNKYVIVGGWNGYTMYTGLSSLNILRVLV
jgi:hypothetical protein